MARLENIKAIFQKAENQIKHIESQYNDSLNEKTINPELKIEIKNFFENLRSILDYLAHEIKESKYVNNAGSPRFYFPILDNLTNFESNMKNWFPQLKINNNDLYEYLKSLQPFNGSDNIWIKNFNTVNNDNKHDNLIEQTREEQERIHVSNNQGGEVSWSPSMVRFGSGVKIFGAQINTSTQMPVSNSSTVVKRILWIDFQFSGVNTSALALMKKSLKEIHIISEQVYKKL